jgi:hypothetical protein
VRRTSGNENCDQIGLSITQLAHARPEPGHAVKIRTEDFMPESNVFERVYVEHERYDGPRAGIADIQGIPHRFSSMWDDKADDYLSTFEVWPIGHVELELEIEQWRIFDEWNAQYESGAVDTDSHPGHGHDPRWNEIENLVRTSRTDVPSNVRHATAPLQLIDRENRYEVTGPDYRMSWTFG